MQEKQVMSDDLQSHFSMRIFRSKLVVIVSAVIFLPSSVGFSIFSSSSCGTTVLLRGGAQLSSRSHCHLFSCAPARSRWTPMLMTRSMPEGSNTQSLVDIELENAMRLNDLLMIQDMIERGAVPANIALCRAIQLEAGQDIFEMALQMGASPDAIDSFGRTALMLAVTHQDASAAQALLAAGAKVEGLGGTYNGRTALMQAACAGDIQLVELLLRFGADVNAMDRYGRNVVQQAAMMRKEKVVRVLEKHLKKLQKEQKQASKSSAISPPLGGGGGGGGGAGEGGGMVQVESDMEQQLWKSILEESKQVPGRPEVFVWRGRCLRQPQPAPDGSCIIIDDDTGETVFQGSPPPAALDAGPDSGEAAGASALAGVGAGWGGGRSESTRVVKAAARVAAAPAVAVARLASATVQRSWEYEKFCSMVSGGTVRIGEGFKPADASHGPAGNSNTFGFKPIEAHERDVDGVVQQIRARGGKEVTLSRPRGESHCLRSDAYKKGTAQIDVSNLDGIVGVQQLGDGGWLALVETRVSMEALVDAMLPLGLMPPVVPGFKRVTVGGAINGLAGDSSSLAGGFFHDTCTSYEIVLGDGTVVTAAPDNDNADLFWSIPGSQGSMGVVTAATVQLVPAEPYVALSLSHFVSPQQLLDHLAAAAARGVDFAEGFGFSAGSLVSVEGRMVGEVEAARGAWGAVRPPRGPLSPWFYRRVQKLRSVMVSAGGHAEVVGLKEYLFRHDRGALWMASYRLPPALGRLLGGLLASRRMFAMADALPAVLPRDQIVLQTALLPAAQSAAFVADLSQALDLWPLWFCPVRNFGPPGPIFSVPADGGELYVAVGAYGVPKNGVEYGEDNQELEMAMLRRGGRKVHHSVSFYPIELFYASVYNGNAYAALREKYHAEGVFPHVHQKVVEEG